MKKQIQPGSYLTEPCAHNEEPRGLHSSQKRVLVDGIGGKASTQDENCITPTLVEGLER